MTPPPVRPIATWSPGDTVLGFALLRKKEVRQDKSGREYLDLELADASGSIPGKAWSDSAALAAEFEPFDFVKFRGQVQSYRDQLQLKVDNCRRVVEADRAEGFDEGHLVPTTREDIDALWRALTATLDGQLRRPFASRLAESTLQAFGERLRVHPAAKAIHHAYRGGLLEHTTSMMGLAARLCDHYPELDRDLVLLGVLFHDLGKLEELGAMPRNDYTAVGRLVGHIVLGRDLVREQAAAIDGFPADLRLQLEHLVLSHQGRQEFGSPVEPMTPEAIALHAIDDLDSKLAVLRGLKERALVPGFVWARSLDRFVWLADLPGADTPEPPNGELADADPEGPLDDDGDGDPRR
ncbi:MAG: HD domain-containing protein [Thermoanaerobaculia bacterium]|nr:HD domain-containing protein [Thermoanaerobaculia bacterium]